MKRKLTAFLQLQEFTLRNQPFTAVSWCSPHNSSLNWVGHILAKATDLRINLNIDGAPIASRSHTHPSHSESNLSPLNLVSIFRCPDPVPRASYSLFTVVSRPYSLSDWVDSWQKVKISAKQIYIKVEEVTFETLETLRNVKGCPSIQDFKLLLVTDWESFI
jgi:hypothetical protein